MILTVLVVRSPAPTQAAQFVISSASWSYPDEYGQGIQYLSVYNSTGDWIDTIGYNVTGSWLYEQDVFEIPFNETLTIAVYSWLNKTQLGLSSFEDGKNFLRHSITVSYPSTTVFTQQNFTYETGTDANDPMYFYKYNVTLPCFNTHGVIYTVEPTLEIFIPDPYSDPYLATDGDAGTNVIGAYTDTRSVDASYYSGFGYTAQPFWVLLNFTVPSNVILDSFNFSIYGYQTVSAVNTGPIYFYNWTSATFDSTGVDGPTGTTAGSISWVNDTETSSPHYWSDDNEISVQWYIGGVGLTDYIYVDYAEVRFTTAPTWQELGVAELIFHVGWDPVFQFGYDTFFIFLGLIMIVASTMYLVRGGKDELSSDKFFYFLILFIMGWALFVGGIMP